MSVWHVGHTERPVSIEQVIETLQKVYGKNHVFYKQTAEKSSGQWKINDKPVGLPIILGEIYGIIIDTEGWYQLSYGYDEETEEQTYTCIQTQNHVPDTPIIKILKRFGGKYYVSDCNDEFEIIVPEEV